MLKPMDIHNKEFKKVVRGYDVEEVDEFLDEIIIDYEQMQRDLELLKEQVSTYSNNMSMYKEREGALNNALISAQQFADNIKKDAKVEASKIIDDAKIEASRIIGDTEGKMQSLTNEYKLLLDKYEEIRSNVCEYLKAQIEMVEEANLQVPIAEEVIKEVKAEKEVKHENLEETKINEKIKELMDSNIYK